MTAQPDAPSLAEWLLARVAEDEAGALAATRLPWGAPPGMAVRTPTGYKVAPRVQKRANREHIARHDPARVLRACESVRRVVALHREDEPEVCMEDDQVMPCTTLRALALRWADRDGYREEWA